MTTEKDNPPRESNTSSAAAPLADRVVTTPTDTNHETDTTNRADTSLNESVTSLAALATETAADLTEHLSAPPEPGNVPISRDQYTALFLYQHAQDIPTVELVARLRKNPDLRAQFGLYQTPSQPSFRYAWRTRFTTQDRRVISTAAAQLRNHAPANPPHRTD